MTHLTRTIFGLAAVGAALAARPAWGDCLDELLPRPRLRP